MDQENLSMQLIVHAGNARSKAMEAILAAVSGNFDLAEQKMAESDRAMTIAHEHQTDILQQSFDSPGEGVSVLLAHAQDHIMNAITVHDLGRELCSVYKRLNNLEKNNLEKEV